MQIISILSTNIFPLIHVFGTNRHTHFRIFIYTQPIKQTKSKNKQRKSEVKENASELQMTWEMFCLHGLQYWIDGRSCLVEILLFYSEQQQENKKNVGDAWLISVSIITVINLYMHCDTFSVQFALAHFFQSHSLSLCFAFCLSISLQYWKPMKSWCQQNFWYKIINKMSTKS